jgi:hypothetical protein
MQLPAPSMPTTSDSAASSRMQLPAAKERLASGSAERQPRLLPRHPPPNLHGRFQHCHSVLLHEEVHGSNNAAVHTPCCNVNNGELMVSPATWQLSDPFQRLYDEPE